MKILFDTNIVLDLMLDRKPHSLAAELLFSYVESNQIQGYLCATTVTTIDYLLSKSFSKIKTRQILQKLLMLFDIASVNRLVLEDALNKGFIDFEDSVIHSAALHCGVNGIITRNEKDFTPASIPIYSPQLFINGMSLKLG